MVELREQSLSWSEIAESFPERSWGALKQRYNGLMRDPLAPKGRRGRIWTPEEDERLLELARTGIPWEEIAESLPGRSPEAIEGHYYKLLVQDKQAPTITRKRYTVEEDNILLEALEEGLSIIEVSRLLKRSKQSVYRRIVKLEKLERFNPASLSIKHRNYTVDELGLIHELREKGITWKQIQSEHFPERALTGIRRRYKQYQKERDSRESEG